MFNSVLAAARPRSRRPAWAACIAAHFLALAPEASTAQSAAPPPTFDELEARLADHPSIAALRAEVQAREDLSVAERSLPDPVVSLGVNNIPVRDPGFKTETDANKSIGVAQEIPNPGVRRARSARERGEAQRLGAAIDYRLAQLRADLIASLAEKRRIREQIGYAQNQLEKVGQLQELLRGEMEAGRPVYYRVSAIDVERADVERTIVNLRTSLAETDAKLVALIDEAPDVDPPGVTMVAWDGGALALRASRIADADVAIAKAGVREGKAAFGPNFGVNFAYMQRQDGIDVAGTPFRGDDWFAAGVSISLPLWAPKNQAPRLRAARARQSSAELSYRGAYRDIRQRLTTLAAQYGAAERNLALFNEKLKALDATIAALRRNYEAGNGDYAQVLDAEIAKLTLSAEVSMERANMIAHAAHFNAELVTP